MVSIGLDGVSVAKPRSPTPADPTDPMSGSEVRVFSPPANSRPHHRSSAEHSWNADSAASKISLRNAVRSGTGIVGAAGP